MEYCAFGDLQNYLNKNGKLPEEDAQEIIAQVAQGLQYMHVEGFAHRDLKPEVCSAMFVREVMVQLKQCMQNILITCHPPKGAWWVKIRDFGLSKRMEEATGATIFGSHGFQAPENKFNGDMAKSYRYAADVWCLGETAFRLLANEPLFPSPGPELHNYFNGKTQFPIQRFSGMKTSDHGISFIRSAMAAMPSDRLDAQHCVVHPWISADTDADGVSDYQRAGDVPRYAAFGVLVLKLTPAISMALEAPEGLSFHDSSTRLYAPWSSNGGSSEASSESLIQSLSLDSTLLRSDGQNSLGNSLTRQQSPRSAPLEKERFTIQVLEEDVSKGSNQHREQPDKQIEEVTLSLSERTSSAIDLETSHEENSQKEEQSQITPRIAEVDSTEAPLPPKDRDSKQSSSSAMSPTSELHERPSFPSMSKKQSSFMQRLNLIPSKSTKMRSELLCQAAKDGDVPKARTLLEAGADIHGTGPDGYTALGLAAENDNVELALLLLEHGADVRRGWKGRWMKEPRNDLEKKIVMPPLHLAAKTGSVALVNLLISYGANVNESAACLNKPWFISTMSLRLPIEGWSVYKTVPLGITNNAEVARVLLENGARANGNADLNSNEYAPLLEAALYRRIPCARVLLQHNAPTEQRSPGNRTALFLACEEDGSEESLELVKLLLASGASPGPRIIASRSWSPLGNVCCRSPVGQYDVESARLLIEANATVDSYRKGTWLHHLCENFHFEDADLRCDLIRIVLSAGSSAITAPYKPLRAVVKTFSVFLFRQKNRPNDEEAIRQFLQLFIILIKVSTGFQDLVKDLQQDQSRIRRLYSPQNAKCLDDMQAISYDRKERTELPSTDIVLKRIELVLLLLSWTRKIEAVRGLEKLEDYVHEFWDIIDKLGLSGKTKLSESLSKEGESEDGESSK